MCTRLAWSVFLIRLDSATIFRHRCSCPALRPRRRVDGFSVPSAGKKVSVFLCFTSSRISSSVSLRGYAPFRLTCSGRRPASVQTVPSCRHRSRLFRTSSSIFVFLAALQTPCNKNTRRSVFRTGRKPMYYILTPFSRSLSISYQ